jgi:hypothetical protein
MVVLRELAANIGPSELRARIDPPYRETMFFETM